MSNVIAQFHKGKYVNKPVQIGTTLAKDVILEDGDSVDAKFRRLKCNSNGELAFKGKNIVRSVNGVGADAEGNVTISSLIPNQIIQSPVPLTEANLHLLDGALLSGDGAYAKYVAMMGELYNADPTATCWTTESDWQTSVTTYGECGKFVYDSESNTLRLPKLKSFIQATTTANELGSLVEAGLPNITGQTMHRFPGGSGCFIAGDASSVVDWYNPLTDKNLKFDASRSNPIYGNSETVQPQAIKYYFYIVIGTVSKTDIQIDIDNVLTDLNGKADKDLSNVTAPTQAFKNMSIGWGMPDWSSVITITSHFTTANGSFTAPSDGYIQVLKVGDNYAYIYNKPNMAWTTTDNVFIFMDGSNGDGVFVYAFVPISKGQTIYQTSSGGFRSDAGRINFIPCKGAN